MPSEGIHAPDVILRLPTLDDVDALLPAFADPETRDAGNLPAFGRAELVASLGELPALAESGRLLPLAALDTGFFSLLPGEWRRPIHPDEVTRISSNGCYDNPWPVSD